ncbi:MAG: hypothetical protein HN757_14230 [Calditrichaeota bacterium]|nr:hypothetical protein [Calditrichota bacterium]
MSCRIYQLSSGPFIILMPFGLLFFVSDILFFLSNEIFGSDGFAANPVSQNRNAIMARSGNI